MTQSIDVRERHVTAFRKTTNLGRKALEHERQLLGSRSPVWGSVGLGAVFVCALVGASGAALGFGAPSLFCAVLAAQT